MSDSQRSPLPDLNWLATCHNAIAMDSYPFHPGNDGYLLFLGRMSPDKGAHHAAALARETGLPMILAGKMHDVEERQHFAANVEPLLGGNIEYVGEVSHDEKVRLLQHARATVFPIQWPEPFGLVMVESMACGTPVVATRQGAVPEVIEQGRSGIIVDSPAELAEAVQQAITSSVSRPSVWWTTTSPPISACSNAGYGRTTSQAPAATSTIPASRTGVTSAFSTPNRP